MSAEENKALVRRFYEEIDRGNLDALDELVTEDYINHTPQPFPVPAGREGLKYASKLFRDATPGYHQIEDMIAEGDRVVTRLTAYGTHVGEMAGIPPTGHKLTMTGIAIHRIADGKIVEHWSDKDMLGLMQQLGVLPPLQLAHQ